ncbi:MAG: bifunctional folylpolyglutamate synthase/dihydrofolate synthase, partial [Rhodospirillales bacterium]
AAFLAFSRHPADLLLLETGLGGRLDATSVVERPALTVLTPISVDHQQYLGDGLEKIAGEKAGILKAGVACVVASQQRKVEKVIARRAAEQGAPLIREGKDWFVHGRGGVVFSSGGKTQRLPPPALVGAHQVRNAGLALACLDQLRDFAVADAAIALGMKAVQWPARLQRLAGGPLVDILPDGWELWLDGGHNAAAAGALARQARRWRERPLHLIFGMLRTKDPLAFLQPLAGKVNALRAVAIPGEESSLNAGETAAAAARLGIDAAAAVEVDAALQSLVDHFPGPARVLICGSLYLAGEVLRENG